MDCVCEKPGSMAGMYKGSMTMSLGSVPSLGCFVVPGVHERLNHHEMIEGNFNGPNSCKTSMDLDLVTCLNHVQRNKCLTFGLDGLV